MENSSNASLDADAHKIIAASHHDTKHTEEAMMHMRKSIGQ